MQMQRGARGFSFVAVQQGPDEIPAVSQSCEQMFTTMRNYEGIHKTLGRLPHDLSWGWSKSKANYTALTALFIEMRRASIMSCIFTFLWRALTLPPLCV